MIEYKWCIDPMMVENKLNGLENVVVKVTWVCHARESEFQSSASGYVPLEIDFTKQFTPFEQLTEIQVWGWIDPYIDKTIIEEGLAAVIEGQKHPQYSYLPTPWSQS